MYHFEQNYPKFYRQDEEMCGVELIMDQFDVEESEGCEKAALVVAGRRYCGTMVSGAHSNCHRFQFVILT